MRVLVVLSDPVAPGAIRERCEAHVREGHDVAICYVLAPQTSLHAALDTQREVTAALRRAFGTSAEAIPVFVVTGGAGDQIDDCARAWGATDVIA